MKHQFYILNKLLISQKQFTVLALFLKQLTDMLILISVKFRNVNFRLCYISKIRKPITFKTCKSIVTSHVLSTLDYCDILLINLTSKYPLLNVYERAVRKIYNLPYRYINSYICITIVMAIVKAI